MNIVNRRTMLSVATLATLLIGLNPFSDTAVAGNLDADVERTLPHFHA